MADTIGILLTTEHFLEEEDVDEVEDDIFPFLINNHLFRRENVPSVQGFYEEVVPTLSSSDFERHFRLSKETFNRIMQEIEPDISKIVRTMDKQPIVPKKRAMVCLWYLCNTSSIREIALLFGLSQSTVFK